MMKKVSGSLSLLLMGSLAATLGGCGSDESAEEFRAYSSIDECVKEELFTPAECRELAIAAVAQNPKFANLEECEKAFGAGQCQAFEEKDATASGEGRSSWMPLVAGYMVGRYLGAGSMMQSAQPLYQQPGQQPGASRAYRTLGGGSVQADARGMVNKPSPAIREGFTKSAKPAAARAGGTSVRGGFTGGKASS